MGVTKRFALLIAVCAVLTAASGFAGGTGFAVAAFLISNSVAVVLLIYDLAATPNTDCLEAERNLDKKLSLNHEHTAEISVRNTSDHSLNVEITDDVPDYFEVGEMPKPQPVSAHSFASFSYKLKPLKRGEYRFPALTLRYPGVLGLIRRTKTVRTEDAIVRVYPNMHDLSEYGIAALSQNLLVNGIRQVKKTADAGEFSTLRPYLEGDNYRLINWPATARAGSLIVNTFSPERNQYIYAMIDASRVMNSRYRNVMILDYAINASFLLADYCIRGGDNFGAQLFASEVQSFVKAEKRAGQMDRIAELFFAAESSENAADYERAMEAFTANVKRRSLIFVFTQLFNAEEALRFAGAVKALMGRHLVCAVTIRDPRLYDCACGRTESGEDGGAGKKGGHDETDDVYRKSAALKYVKDREHISDILKNAGILNLDSDPDKLSLSAVSAYLNIKNRGLL